MIRVHIELDSAITGKTRSLAFIAIRNDVTGTARRGNYTVIARQARGRKTYFASVKNFPRKSRSALELLRRALNELEDVLP